MDLRYVHECSGGESGVSPCGINKEVSKSNHHPPLPYPSLPLHEVTGTEVVNLSSMGILSSVLPRRHVAYKCNNTTWTNHTNNSVLLLDQMLESKVNLPICLNWQVMRT